MKELYHDSKSKYEVRGQPINFLCLVAMTAFGLILEFGPVPDESGGFRPEINLAISFVFNNSSAAIEDAVMNELHLAIAFWKSAE